MTIFHFFSCHNIKKKIMTSYVQIGDDAIIFFNFTAFLSIVYAYQVMPNHVCWQALISYSGNSEWPILSLSF